MGKNRIRPHVTIYATGRARLNPGPGGYGVVLLYGQNRKELSRSFELTTINRAHLFAVIAGLEALSKPCQVFLYNTSQYVIDAVENGSVFRLRNNEWKTLMGEKTKNSDLWERFATAFEKHDIELIRIKKGSSVPDYERCDELAIEAIESADKFCDVGYLPNGDDQITQLANIQSLGTKSKITHTQVGEACRKCGTAIIRRNPKRKKLKQKQTYYYEWYLYCPNCKAMYMVEEAKRIIH